MWELIFRCHKSPLYSHSGVFWLAGPTVPVTPHYLSDNARCTAPLNNAELIFLDIFAKSLFNITCLIYFSIILDPQNMLHKFIRHLELKVEKK